MRYPVRRIRSVGIARACEALGDAVDLLANMIKQLHQLGHVLMPLVKCGIEPQCSDAILFTRHPVHGGCQSLDHLRVLWDYKSP